MDIESEITRFKNDWEIDFPKNTIRRKSVGIFQSLINALRKPKYPVIALYRFAQFHLSTEDGIVWPNFMDRNAGNEIAGVPSWYQLSEEWSISEKDLKCLFLGPLVKGEEVIVPALPESAFFTSLWEIVKIIATIGGVLGFIVMVVKWLGG